MNDYDHIYTLARLLEIEGAFREHPDVQSAKRFDCEFSWTGLIVKYADYQDLIPLEWKPVKNVKNQFYVRIFEGDEIKRALTWVKTGIVPTSSDDAVCENCEKPAEYNGEMCLCPKCEKEACM